MALTSKDRKKIAKSRLSHADLHAINHEMDPLPEKDISHFVNELKLYQLELSRQHKSPSEDMHALPTAERYNFVPAGFFSQDKNGLIVEVSAAGTKVLGLDKQGLVHRMKMAHADRTTTIHELASILVHEINQPLAAITNYLHGCIRRLETGSFQTDDIVYALNQAVKQSQRTSEIIQNLKYCSLQENYHFESVCLNSLVKDAIAFVELDTDFSYQFTPALNNSHVMLDKIHLQQAIYNLIRYAAATLQNATLAHHNIAVELNQSSKHCITFCMSYHGPTLTTDAFAQLLHPEYASSTGDIVLDIAVGRRIIEAHGGSLELYYDELKGNCFQFTLCSQMLSASPLF